MQQESSLLASGLRALPRLRLAAFEVHYCGVTLTRPFWVAAPF